MKILHTADWHIGKVLHKQALQEEHRLFFDWLLKTIAKEEIDLLLISGDIFDLANPAAKDRELYYNFLSQLIGSKTSVIITGGNHDSIGVLNAPREVLNALNIHVIGGAKEDLRDELIEIKNEEGSLELIVAAVPYLRDRDLRQIDASHKQSSRVEAIRAGIKMHYDSLADLAKKLYPTVPLIGMGHLYTKGSITSESEREIQIGNTAAIEAKHFSDAYAYLALGHIHRPQVIDKNEYIRYSGSPIALSFSERSDEKIVIIVSIEDGKVLSPNIIPVPKFRALKKVSGSLDTVTQQLDGYKDDSTLPAFIEIEVNEDQFSTQILAQVENLIALHKTDIRFIILKSKVNFEQGSKDTADLFKSGTNVEDLTPQEVFQRKLESENATTAEQKTLKEAFSELLEYVHEQEGL